MKLEARTRLVQSQVEAVTYEQYCAVVARLDTSVVQAFEFKMPGILKHLWSDLQVIATHLKEDAGIGIQTIVKAFQEKSTFRLLKGIGFSLMSLLKAVKAAMAMLSKPLLYALEELHSRGVFKHLEKGAIAVDDLLKEFPILKKVTGVAVAGILVVMYLKASFIGDVDRDLNIVGSIIACLHGSYSIHELFASPEGLFALATVVMGLVTGVSVVSYGYSAIEKGLEFLGSHGSNVYALMLAMFYAGARKLHERIDYSDAPKFLK